MSGIFIFFFLKVKTLKTTIIEELLAIDWLGSITIVGATVMIPLGLGYGGLACPWNSATVICLLVFGVLTLIFFVLIEGRLPNIP